MKWLYFAIALLLSIMAPIFYIMNYYAVLAYYNTSGGLGLAGSIIALISYGIFVLSLFIILILYYALAKRIADYELKLNFMKLFPQQDGREKNIIRIISYACAFLCLFIIKAGMPQENPLYYSPYVLLSGIFAVTGIFTYILIFCSTE